MRTIPHAPFPPTATARAEGRRTIVLIQRPMPHIRLTGELGYENGYANPYTDPDSPEAVNWEAGWRDAMQRDS